MRLVERLTNKTGGIDGHPLNFAFRDDQSQPQVGVQLVNDATAAKPAVIFGSTISAICNAMAPLLATGPVDYCLSPGIHPPAGSYVFTASVSSSDYLKALLRYFRLKGWTRIAIITTTDASGQDIDRGFAQTLAMPENHAIKIVAHVHFNPSDVSIAAQMARIRAAHPQAVIGWATGAAGATVFRGLVEAGIDLPTAASTSNMTFAQMIRYAAFLPKQLYFAVPEWVADGDPRLGLDPAVVRQQKQYFATMRAAGIEPDAATETGWDPPHVVIALLRKLGPGATAAQLRDAMVHLKGFAGIDGFYNYPETPQRGINVTNTVIARWNPTAKHWYPVSKPGGTPLKP